MSPLLSGSQTISVREEDEQEEEGGRGVGAMFFWTCSFEFVFDAP